eukprot:1157454-Pelagomonas_calceolata.AAC.13
MSPHWLPTHLRNAVAPFCRPSRVKFSRQTHRLCGTKRAATASAATASKSTASASSSSNSGGGFYDYLQPLSFKRIFVLGSYTHTHTHTQGGVKCGDHCKCVECKNLDTPPPPPKKPGGRKAITVNGRNSTFTSPASTSSPVVFASFVPRPTRLYLFGDCRREHVPSKGVKAATASDAAPAAREGHPLNLATHTAVRLA